VVCTSIPDSTSRSASLVAIHTRVCVGVAVWATTASTAPSTGASSIYRSHEDLDLKIQSVVQWTASLS
jgi:hypothetical protein